MSISKVQILLMNLPNSDLEKFIRWNSEQNRSPCKDELIRILSRRVVQVEERKSLYETYSLSNRRYSDKEWRYLNSTLYQNLRTFMAQVELKRDAFLEDFLFLRSLRKINALEIFQKEFGRITEQLKPQFETKREQELASMLFLEEAYKVEVSKRRDTMSYLHELNTTLNEYFISSKLQFLCSAESHRSMAAFELEDPFGNIQQIVEEGGHVVQRAYLAALKTQSGEISVEEFLERLEEIKDTLKLSERRELYLMAINRCIRLYNQGDTNYLTILFDLYKKGLSENLFIEEDNLSRFTYRNIASAAVGMKDFEWAGSFLKEYQEYLPKNQKDDLFNYHSALLALAQKDYDTAIELLRDSRFKDPLMILDARRMLIKVYYETDEWDALNYLLDSFWSYLYRHKELGYHRKNYLNMVKYLKKILSIQHKDDGVKAKWKKRIEDSENVAEKNWLLSLI